MRKVTCRSVAIGLVLGLAAGCAGPLTESALPVKPTGFLHVERNVDGDAPGLSVRRLSPGDAVLFGPHFGLTADWVATWDSIPAEDAESLGISGAAKGFRAADGHEFVAMRISEDTQWEKGRWSRESDAELTATVTAGKRAKRLADVPEPGTLIVASVPKSQPATLTITDEGRPLSFDLRTAKPTGTRFRILTQNVDHRYGGSGEVSTPAGRRLVSIDIWVDEISLEPYFPGLGWAKDGRRWLRLSLGQASSDAHLQPDIESPAVGFLLDPASTFELEVDGAKLRPSTGRVFNTMSPMARYTAVIEVPDSWRSGDLTIAPDGPIFMYRGGSVLTDYTKISEPPSCGERKPVICLDWQRRPKSRVVNVALE